MEDNPLLVKCPQSGECDWCPDNCVRNPHCSSCVCHGDGLVIPRAPPLTEIEELNQTIAILRRSCKHYADTIRCPRCKYCETFGEPFLIRATPCEGYPHGYFFCDRCGIVADFVEPKGANNG
jgi:hypothetical protein